MAVALHACLLQVAFYVKARLHVWESGLVLHDPYTCTLVMIPVIWKVLVIIAPDHPSIIWLDNTALLPMILMIDFLTTNLQ